MPNPRYKLLSAEEGTEVKRCAFFGTQMGCRSGSKCRFSHGDTPPGAAEEGAGAATTPNATSETAGRPIKVAVEESKRVSRSVAKQEHTHAAPTAQEETKKEKKKKKPEKAKAAPPSASGPSATPCPFYATAAGCQHGDLCAYSHDVTPGSPLAEKKASSSKKRSSKTSAAAPAPAPVAVAPSTSNGMACQTRSHNKPAGLDDSEGKSAASTAPNAFAPLTAADRAAARDAARNTSSVRKAKPGRKPPLNLSDPFGLGSNGAPPPLDAASDSDSSSGSSSGDSSSEEEEGSAAATAPPPPPPPLPAALPTPSTRKRGRSSAGAASAEAVGRPVAVVLPPANGNGTHSLLSSLPIAPFAPAAAAAAAVQGVVAASKNGAPNGASAPPAKRAKRNQPAKAVPLPALLPPPPPLPLSPQAVLAALPVTPFQPGCGAHAKSANSGKKRKAAAAAAAVAEPAVSKAEPLDEASASSSDEIVDNSTLLEEGEVAPPQPHAAEWLPLVDRTRAHPKYATLFNFAELVDEGGWATSRECGPECRGLPQVLAIDCEMCMSEDPVTKKRNSKELLRMSIINGRDGATLLDTLVRPTDTVLDFRSWIHGVTPQHLATVAFTAEHARAAMAALCCKCTVLIGHALHNDLQALRFAHDCCVDTAMLFTVQDSPSSTPALRDVVRSCLKRDIQAGAHDSVSDAVAALDAAKYLLKHGSATPVVRAARGDKARDNTAHMLLVHRIPPGMASEHLNDIFLKVAFVAPTNVSEIDVGTSTRHTGNNSTPSRSGKAMITFRSAKHADLAFDALPGEGELDKGNRLQKRVFMQNKDYVQIRKMQQEVGAAKDEAEQ